MTAIETHRRGDWTQTYTGRQFWPLDPRAEDIDPRDVAHALSLQCRYNGMVRSFYSVAEHCVLMSLAVAPEHALHALLHDATEAYVGDMVRPLKNHMRAYRAAEDLVWAAVAERFGVDPTIPDEVHDADARIVLDERSALLSASPAPWAIDHLTPLGVQIQGWTPLQAEGAYLDRLVQLRRRATTHAARRRTGATSAAQHDETGTTR
jgi:hypothetical protein